MKAATFAILLGAAALPALAQTTDDHDRDAPVHVRIHCETDTGKCKPPPAPPVPPAPPAPPAPPPPPRLPSVPAEAHAACASKPAGSALTWDLSEGGVMTGVCARRDGKMVFVLRSYER
ncbi:hypothetical protein [Massilia rhizosphaerae]|uniref:hypothetical protein n=1 Tax=Massilia rhizosphaerae TaxID=2784389 RepID=UPI0018DD6522|nr:hypothetical protein [Massilia rhizosphaerae]